MLNLSVTVSRPGSKTDMFEDIDPEDIAYLAKFLASTESSYVTGEVIDVNGGKDL